MTTGPVFVPIHVEGPRLHVLSAQFRVYVGLSREGDYLHVVSPAVALHDQDGNVVRPDGALACTCKGATYHGSCYRLKQAQAHERGDVDVDVWIHDAAPGELVEAFGK